MSDIKEKLVTQMRLLICADTVERYLDNCQYMKMHQYSGKLVRKLFLSILTDTSEIKVHD